MSGCQPSYRFRYRLEWWEGTNQTYREFEEPGGLLGVKAAIETRGATNIKVSHQRVVYSDWHEGLPK